MTAQSLRNSDIRRFPFGFYRAEADGRLTEANDALARCLGWPDATTLMRESPEAPLGLAGDPRGREGLLAALARDNRVGWITQVRRYDGRPAWISESLFARRDRWGRLHGFDGLVQDLTVTTEPGLDLYRRAFEDPVTALPNRLLLVDRLDQALRRCRREPSLRMGLAVLRLDRLGLIYESLGPQAGDALVREAARRLRAAVRPSDTLARVGEDRLAIMLDDCGDEAAAEAALRRLLAGLRPPLDFAGEELELGASAGLAVGGGERSGGSSMLRDAEAALNRACEAGREALVVFDNSMYAEASRRLALEQGLKRAVERSEIWVAFQPIVALDGGAVRGFEALARWNHPRLGSVGPEQFIPVAEASGLIEGIGARVLEVACDRAQAWRGAGGAGTPFISVNLSPRQLQAGNLPALVGETLARHRLGPGALKLEITESLLVREPARARVLMEALADLGATLWLDDFGTGYSSLATLAQFPFHGLKLDRSFVRDLESSQKARDLLDGALALARRLRLQVVAEGVETVAQARLLREAGCGLAQGWLFARALGAREAELFLHQGRLGAAPI